MAAVANSPSFAKKAGVPQSVGSDFVQADKGRKFAKGGDTMATKKIFPFMGKETPKEEKREMAIKAKSKAKYFAGEKAEGIHGKSGMKKPTAYAKGGFTKSADGIAENGRTKAQRFADGGAMGQTPLRPATPAPSATNSPSMAPKSPTVMGGPASKMGPDQGIGSIVKQLSGVGPKQTIPMPSQGSVKGPAPINPPQVSAGKPIPIKPPQVSSVNPKVPLDFLLNRKPGTGLTNPPSKPMSSVGGSPIGGKNPNAKPTPIPPEFLNFDKNSTVNIKKGGEVKAKKYASGGCVSSKPVKTMARGGGCEVKGKTRGRYI
jgi:hypothetical protein